MIGIQGQDIQVLITLSVSIGTAFAKIIFVMMGWSILGLMIADYVFPVIGLIYSRRVLYQRLPNLSFSIRNLPCDKMKEIAKQGLSIQIGDFGRIITTSIIPWFLNYLFPIMYGTPATFQLYYNIILKISVLSLELGAQITSPLMTGTAALKALNKI